MTERSLPERAPEIEELVRALAQVPSGPDMAGERMDLVTQWLDVHGYDLSDWTETLQPFAEPAGDFTREQHEAIISGPNGKCDRCGRYEDDFIHT